LEMVEQLVAKNPFEISNVPEGFMSGAICESAMQTAAQEMIYKGIMADVMMCIPSEYREACMKHMPEKYREAYEKYLDVIEHRGISDEEVADRLREIDREGITEREFYTKVLKILSLRTSQRVGDIPSVLREIGCVDLETIRMQMDSQGVVSGQGVEAGNIFIGKTIVANFMLGNASENLYRDWIIASDMILAEDRKSNSHGIGRDNGERERLVEGIRCRQETVHQQQSEIATLEAEIARGREQEKQQGRGAQGRE